MKLPHCTPSHQGLSNNTKCKMGEDHGLGDLNMTKQINYEPSIVDRW
jgi:hypothetical protein